MNIFKAMYTSDEHALNVYLIKKLRETAYKVSVIFYACFHCLPDFDFIKMPPEATDLKESGMPSDGAVVFIS